MNRVLDLGRRPADPAAFRAVFDLFKNVLEGNNRALEGITDMGEKLGGDYLFDIVYVRKAYADLKRDMEYSLATFDKLTRGRHQKVRHVFEHIDSVITRVLSEAPALPAAPALFLEEIAWGSEQITGGKACHLAEVKNQIGMHVPEGFVITTAAFDAFIKFNKLEDRIANLRQAGSQESALQELQELILHGEIPFEISHAIRKALRRMRRRRAISFLAVRSSAQEEDSAHSFAGQFKTVLCVPVEPLAIERAYRRVIASLFSLKAVAYEQQTGYDPASLKMAVACMAMVDAVSSGVIYSTKPDGDAETMMISAAWGLGEAVVEGRTGTDMYVVRKLKDPEPVRAAIGEKDKMIVCSQKGGTEEIAVSDDLRNKPCLSPEQIKTLALDGMKLERYFGSPRDIEWAIDKTGRTWILQARPLKVQFEERNGPPLGPAPDSMHSHPLLMHDKGIVVQRGAGAGKVFIAKRPSDIASLPKGAVLVAGHDSSLFVRSMPFVSAIVTETGSETSHMAALCRELKIPTIVNLPRATEMLIQGQNVTVVAGEEGRSLIYGGIVKELLDQAGQDRQPLEAVYEFRRKRYILRYISPLHLIDPLMDEFTPERCRSMHDILRFMHEKAVAELVESARRGSAGLRKRGMVVPLELPVPAGILVMDMGGGLEGKQGRGKAAFEEITSIPFKAIIEGMIHPGAWHAEAVALRAGDFLSSMMRMPDITSDAGSSAGYNVAVISREYVNMSIRFGYHYNMIDCYLSENAKNNHIYFRFAGGATDLLKRSRRLDLIAKILAEYGFAVKVKGDLLTARLGGLPAGRMEQVLNQTGRLIAYARQLDAMLHDDRDIERFLSDFKSGNYEFSGSAK